MRKENKSGEIEKWWKTEMWGQFTMHFFRAKMPPIVLSLSLSLFPFLILWAHASPLISPIIFSHIYKFQLLSIQLCESHQSINWVGKPSKVSFFISIYFIPNLLWFFHWNLVWHFWLICFWQVDLNLKIKATINFQQVIMAPILFISFAPKLDRKSVV